MTTIIDVAKAANVSPSTVSRVIADNPRISLKTKRKVRAVMKELAYYPNVQARNLAAKKTMMLGVVMGHAAMLAFQNPFFPEVIRGISATAHAKKYGISLSTGATEREIFDEVREMVQGKKVDGIILLYAKKGDAVFDYLVQAQFPFVVVGTPFTHQTEVDYIDNDNVTLAEQLTDYLIKLGHEHIAFIGGDIQYGVTRDRVKGFEKSYDKHGLDVNEAYCQYNAENIEATILKLLQLKQPPTAILAQDDLTAYEMVTYLNQQRIRVPEDMSILSINNHALSSYVRPALTTVDIHIFELGYKAAELVCQRIENPTRPATHLFVETAFIERASCTKR